MVVICHCNKKKIIIVKITCSSASGTAVEGQRHYACLRLQNRKEFVGWGKEREDMRNIKAPEVNFRCYTSFHIVQIPKCWMQVSDYDNAVTCEKSSARLIPTLCV